MAGHNQAQYHRHNPVATAQLAAALWLLFAQGVALYIAAHARVHTLSWTGMTMLGALLYLDGWPALTRIVSHTPLRTALPLLRAVGPAIRCRHVPCLSAMLLAIQPAWRLTERLNVDPWLHLALPLALIGLLLVCLVNRWVAYDLAGLDLRQARLRMADLHHANLRNTDLGGADLRDADLRDADLRETNLEGADLFGAELGGACFNQGTRLDPKWRRVCDLVTRGGWNRDLSGANLRGATLTGVSLMQANLREADCRYADLRRVNLAGADLSGADLRDADLREANLRGTILTGARYTYDPRGPHSLQINPEHTVWPHLFDPRRRGAIPVEQRDAWARDRRVGRGLFLGLLIAVWTLLMFGLWSDWLNRGY